VLETGGRWSEAAERLGVHRHTLRYRMGRIQQQIHRDPREPEERLELWLGLFAAQTLAARSNKDPAVSAADVHPDGRN
jgi:purine catabolism regulator